MRALSIRQPWAELIMLGRKRYELRTWSTRLRGRIAIHASKRVDREGAGLAGLRPEELVGGAILGTAELADCVAYTRAMAEELHRARAHFTGWTPGWMAFVLDDPQRVERPIPYPGRLGFFKIPEFDEPRMPSRTGDHFVQYHNSEALGYGCGQITGFDVWTSKPLKWLEERVIGKRVWLLAGEGRPRRYYVCHTFVADEVVAAPSATGFAYVVSGEVGRRRFQDLRIDAEPWFRAFQRSQGNFGLGLRRIRDEFVVESQQLLEEEEQRGSA
jgi:hypothetical protein